MPTHPGRPAHSAEHVVRPLARFVVPVIGAPTWQATRVPAPFVRDLCGYRDGRPNTSDSNDTQSVNLGHALFGRMGVPAEAPEPAGIGSLMEELIVKDLAARRPDLYIDRSKSASAFSQYEHLAAAATARRASTVGSELPDQVDAVVEALQGNPSLGWIIQRLEFVKGKMELNTDVLRNLLDNLPSESMLKMDIAVAGASPPAELRIGLSSKWTLRTDRAQDCLSQGTKLVSQRRGRMPHFAAITMEPRPAMLALLADGSGSVDCVYHLDLGSLVEAAHDLDRERRASNGTGWSPLVTLQRLVRQRRLRDYDALVQEVMLTPAGPGAT